MRERGQWRKRCSRESEELWKEPNIVNIIKSSRLGWAGHVVRMDDNLRKMLWTNPGGQGGRGRPKSRWVDGVEEDARPIFRNWRVGAQDRGHRRHLVEEAKTHPGL